MKNKVLVTGGTGFMSMQIILQLLQQGYNVKTTVRNLNSKERVLDTLLEHGVGVDTLEFVEADLTSDKNWEDNMKDCEYVLSVASPVFFDIPKNEEEAIRPAIEGVLRILKAAHKSGVRRVVMTSNFGAVGFSNKDLNSTTTEENWTNEHEAGLSIYEKSKLLAEKAAWEFANENPNLELVTINPVAVFGPALDSHVSGSFGLLKMLLDPKVKKVPNIPLNVVDVRDVASMHIRAMTTKDAAMQRFIASADGEISMLEIAKLLKKARPELADKVTTRTIPNWFIKIGARFNRQAKEGLLLLEMNRKISNAKAKEVLGWEQLATKEEAVLSAIDSLKKYNLI
ncbi:MULTISPECIES: aldehyde reductase [Listeria]|uniref:SDR family oxidoreductase n=1 Tax=Listeria TaxID=1637 RepID=UPI000B58A754|nr:MULTISPECIES: aldehyde reductase [Listeria]